MWMLPLLTACGVNWGFGGQDMGSYDTEGAEMADELDGDSANAGGGDAVTDLHTLCGDGLEPALELTAGEGFVQVLHTGFEDRCCAVWFVGYAVSGTDLTVSYLDMGPPTPCGCTCSWTFSYRIEGLGPGPWTVYAGDLQSDVTLD